MSSKESLYGEDDVARESWEDEGAAGGGSKGNSSLNQYFTIKWLMQFSFFVFQRYTYTSGLASIPGKKKEEESVRWFSFIDSSSLINSSSFSVHEYNWQHQQSSNQILQHLNIETLAKRVPIVSNGNPTGLLINI